MSSFLPGNIIQQLIDIIERAARYRTGRPDVQGNFADDDVWNILRCWIDHCEIRHLAMVRQVHFIEQCWTERVRVADRSEIVANPFVRIQRSQWSASKDAVRPAVIRESEMELIADTGNPVRTR